MFADYTYYTTTYKGTKIKSADEYEYLGQQASRYIKQYTDIVDDDTKACECAISEYLQGANKQGNITSESIPNAYSVSYKSNENATMMSEINALLQLYLGDRYSAVGIVKIINQNKRQDISYLAFCFQEKTMDITIKVEDNTDLVRAELDAKMPEILNALGNELYKSI